MRLRCGLRPPAHSPPVAAMVPTRLHARGRRPASTPLRIHRRASSVPPTSAVAAPEQTEAPPTPPVSSVGRSRQEITCLPAVGETVCHIDDWRTDSTSHSLLSAPEQSFGEPSDSVSVASRLPENFLLAPNVFPVCPAAKPPTFLPRFADCSAAPADIPSSAPCFGAHSAATICFMSGAFLHASQYFDVIDHKNVFTSKDHAVDRVKPRS